MDTTDTRLLWLARIFGIGLHVPMLLIFILQGLLVPTEVVIFLITVWVVVLGGGVVLWRRRSLLIALIPVIDVVIVYSVAAIGSALFGWRA
jgi:hypothetical protein